MNPIVPSALPGGEPSLAPDPSARMRWLFRLSLREGHVHPLMALIRLHRGDAGLLMLPDPVRATVTLLASPATSPAEQAQRWMHRHWRLLPACPEAVMQAQKALMREDISLDEVADRIACDQALAARALRIANCSLYGVAGRIQTIRQAIGILGLRCVATLLNAAALTVASEDLTSTGFNLHDFWRHSVATALCAREIARLRDHDEDLAFTAGLLHDLGRLALAHQPASDGTEGPFDHAALGACVAEQWHFSPQMIQVMRHHHGPPERPGPLDVLDIVHLADATVHALDLAGRAEEAVPAVAPAAWQRAALAESEWLQVFQAAEHLLDELCEALGVTSRPSKPTDT